MRASWKAAAVGLGMMGLAAGPASASLIGDEVLADVHVSGGGLNVIDPGSGTDPIAGTVVDPGIEFDNTTGIFSTTSVGGTQQIASIRHYVDVGAETITVGIEWTPLEQSLRLSLIPLEYVLTDLDWVGVDGIVVGVEPLGGSFPIGFTTGYTDDSVTLAWDDFLSVGDEPVSYEATFLLLTEHRDPVVPEPATLGLLGLGLSGAAMLRRRRCARLRVFGKDIRRGTGWAPSGEMPEGAVRFYGGGRPAGEDGD